MKYRKKALIVTAYTAPNTQYIATLEGISTANKGDYVVTGIDNEQWVVKPSYFHDSYKHLSGNTYRRIPQVLDAVRIDKEEVAQALTGDIRGDVGDYRITGKKGEHWYVKPDIFDKTYERVNKAMIQSGLQKSIDQLGMELVTRYLPKGMKIHPCDLHGHYLAHYKEPDPVCPLCIKTGGGEGTSATDVEHWINIKDNVQAATGFRPQG